MLYNTRNYLNALKAQISELERRNRLLEMQVRRPDEKEEDGDSNERVRVQISRQATESTPEGEGVNLVIAVRAGCNMIDLIHDVLQCLKRMGATTLLSVEAITGSPQKNDLIKASFTVRVKVILISTYAIKAFKLELFMSIFLRALEKKIYKPVKVEDNNK